MFEPVSTIKVQLDIPANKLQAQAALIVEEYEPIVIKALEEVRQELNFSASFQETVKKAVKDQTKNVIMEIIEDTVRRNVSDSMYKNTEKIKREIAKIMANYETDSTDRKS